jgi:uncharacterized protein (DUF433 family)
MDCRSRISTDSSILHGQACIRGTRIPVSVLLDNLAAGPAPQQIVESYPTVTLDDVSAAVAYGAELARERVIELRVAGHDGSPARRPTRSR